MSIQSYERIYTSALRGKGDQANSAKTFEAWRQNAVNIRNALMEAKKAYTSELSQLWQERKADSYFEAKQPLDAAYNEILLNARKSLEESLQSVIDAKQEQLSKCLEAPSDADIRLLSALNLRTSLTESEVAALASKLNSNIHSLKALKDIAEKNGILFPNYGDLDDINHEMETAKRFSDSMIKAVDHDDLSYFERMFYCYSEQYPMPQYESIDSNYFVSAQLEPVPSGFAPSNNKPEIPAGKAPNAYRVFLSGSESVLGILNQFNVSIKALKAANPGVDIHHLDGVESIIVPTSVYNVGNNLTVRPDQMQPTYIDRGSMPEAEA